MSLLKILGDQDENIPFIDDHKKEELCFFCYGNRKFYWNNCSEIYNKDGKLKFEESNHVKYLDYKLTEYMFNEDESYNCLKTFLTNPQPKKLLHIVNTHHDNHSIFDMKEWNLIVKMLSEYDLNNVIVEIVNKFFGNNEEYISGLKKCDQISNSKRVEYFHYHPLSEKYFIFNNKECTDNGYTESHI